MASSGKGAKRKGDAAEREAAGLLSHHLGTVVRRKLGAGRQDDTGDLDGLPDCVIQVAHWADQMAAIRQKPEAVELQRHNADATFAATMVRLRGGGWRVVMTPEQFATWAREALPWEANNDQTTGGP